MPAAVSLSAAPATRLAHGQFYGAQSARLDTGEVVLALMRPDAALEVERHTHETAHLIVHLRGRYLSSAAGAPASCDGPAVVYNPPGTCHHDRYARAEGSIGGLFLSVGVSATRWNEANAGAPLSAQATFRQDAAALALGARLLRIAHANDGAPAALEAEALVLELLAQHTVASASRTGRAGPPNWLARAHELLRDRSAERVTIREIARACNVHPVYLARAFRRHFGCTPGEVLRRERVSRAAALLTGTGRALSDVALSTGFSDQSHLTTAFRRAHGLTPGAYRTLLSGACRRA